MAAPITIALSMNDTTLPPISAEQLLNDISAQYPSLSRQLKLIGKYVEAHREHLALEGIQEVALACGVQPSAVVRFAQHFGFSGFTEMQKPFRDAISQQIAPGRNYKARIRDAIKVNEPLSSTDIARQFLDESAAGLQELLGTLDRSDFEAAVDLLAAADSIWLVGMRRSFAVASYLEYALQHTDKRVTMIGAMGCMQEGQLRSLRKGDVLLATSFAPYAPETIAIVEAASERGARIIALSDSRMSPLAEHAEAILCVQESTSFGFRSLTGAIGLAQSLFIALAYRLEIDGQ